MALVHELPWLEKGPKTFRDAKVASLSGSCPPLLTRKHLLCVLSFCCPKHDLLGRWQTASHEDRFHLNETVEIPTIRTMSENNKNGMKKIVQPSVAPVITTQKQ